MAYFGGKKMSNDDDLMAMLLGTAKEKRTYLPPAVDEVQVTRSVLNHAQAICDAAKKVSGGSYEWYTLMLGKKEEPYLNSKLYLPAKQKAQPGFIEVSGEEYALATIEIEKYNTTHKQTYMPVGWLHSHGSGGVGFSAEDKKNFDILLNSVWHNTRQRGLKEVELMLNARAEIQADTLVVKGEQLEDLMLELDVPKDSAFNGLLKKYGVKKTPASQATFLKDVFDVLSLSIFEPLLTGYGYAVVVNERGDSYAVLGEVTNKPISDVKTVKITQRTVPLRIEEDKAKIPTNAELEKEVQEKITFVRYVPKPHRKNPWFGRGKGKFKGTYQGPYGPHQKGAHLEDFVIPGSRPPGTHIHTPQQPYVPQAPYTPQQPTLQNYDYQRAIALRKQYSPVTDAFLGRCITEITQKTPSGFILDLLLDAVFKNYNATIQLPLELESLQESYASSQTFRDEFETQFVSGLQTPSISQFDGSLQFHRFSNISRSLAICNDELNYTFMTEVVQTDPTSVILQYAPQLEPFLQLYEKEQSLEDLLKADSTSSTLPNATNTSEGQ
jgi:proteasome lid subunit RPN8/RPN11